MADQTFSVRRGDDGSLAIPVENDDGTYADLTGANMRWSYGFSADGAPLKVKTSDDGITLGTTKVADEEVAAFIVPMPAAETLTLEAFRAYPFQGRVQFPGSAETVITGEFTVDPSQDAASAEPLVEDGTGLPEAVTYAAIITADAYHRARGNSAWFAPGSSQEAKAAALIRATDYLDGLYRTRWLGYPATPDQGLAWPRAYVRAPGGFLPSDALPQALVRACCEVALRELQTPGGLTPDIFPGERVVSETVDVLEVQYAEGGAPTDVLPVIVAVERIVAPLLRSASGSLVMRA